jgi:hypothetical protein
MTQKYEWDYPATMRPRRRRATQQTTVLDGEVLQPQQDRIRVEVRHIYQPQCQPKPPPYVIAILIFAALIWVSPIGFVIAIVMGGILVSAHPNEAICVAALLGIGRRVFDVASTARSVAILGTDCGETSGSVA